MTRTRLPPPPSPAPEVRCRECGRPLDAQWQPGLSSDDGHWIVTCQGLECALRLYTFTVGEYSHKDLTPYYATGRKRREEVKYGQVR